jgi:hypothetical protein
MKIEIQCEFATNSSKLGKYVECKFEVVAEHFFLNAKAMKTKE